MTFNLQWYCAAVLVSAMCQPLAGQNAAFETTAAPNQTNETLEGLSTLEIIRSNSPVLTSENDQGGASGGTEMMMGSSVGGTMGGSMVPSAKQLLLQHVNQVRIMLSDPNADRTELECLLREALAEYFVLDMEERVREFDKVKARVLQMEKKLQSRLDRRYELVEFQLKQMLHKADGLEFFVPDGAAGGSGMSMPGGTSGTPGMAGGMSSPMSQAVGPGMGTDYAGGLDSGLDASGAGGLGASGGSAIGGYGGAPGTTGGGSARPVGVPGYDIGFGMTRYLRFPGKPLKQSDPLKIYEGLDAKTDSENEFSKHKSTDKDEAKLKTLVLAMHNFNDLFKHFPAPANRRYRNEMPHSWRVALLPILGHAELYKQYRFDELWDSENNLKLVEKMPAVFGSNNEPNSEMGKTNFQMLVGNGAAFDTVRLTQMQDITDGTSNTIALVVASESVPWTKPEDIQFVPNATLAKLAPSRIIAMCDGRVRTLPKGGEAVLKIFATRGGGEVSPVE